MSGSTMKNQRGFGLIETIISFALLGTVLVGLISAIQYLHYFAKMQATKSSAERLSGTITELVSMPATLRATLVQSNTAGVPDLWAEARGYKRSNHNGTFQPIRMHLPIVERTGPSTSRTAGQITGTPTYPMRFNAKGEGCNKEFDPCPALDWPIEVYTELNFSCPPLFNKTYDIDLRGGLPYYGPIYPDGLVIQSSCIGKSQANIRLTIQESEDPTQARRGLFKGSVTILPILMSEYGERF